jgi:hypothetical protein
VARVAQHGRVDLEVALRAEDDLLEVDLDAEEGVAAALRARARGTATAAGRVAAEERLEDVAEAAEALRAAEPAVAALVVLLALPRVAQHVIGVRHRFEAVARARLRVDVGVELAGELAVRLLDLFG